MSSKFPKLHAAVGAVASVRSNYIHPSKLFCDKYPNRPKNHKLQGVVLVEVDAKFMRRGANAILFFVFTHFNFTDQQLYATKQYIHVTKQDEEDSLFFLTEAVIHAVSVGAIVTLSVDENNCADGAEANDALILLLGRTLNLHSEDMVELCCQGIAIDNDNNSAPENVPREGETTTGIGNWRREGIICPRKSGNLQNYFSYFRHYSHDAILCMSLLQ